MIMAEERIVTINLRRILMKYPRWKRANVAIRALKEVLKKNAKAEKLKIDAKLNEKIWKIKNASTKIKVKIVKVDEKTYKAELI